MLAPHLAVVIGAAAALAAHAVSPAVADGLARPGAAAVLLRELVLALRALAVRAQPPRIAQAHAALEGAIAVVTGRAGWLLGALTGTVAGEVHGDLQRVLKAHRLDGERAALLLGATVQPRLNAEGHLERAKKA